MKHALWIGAERIWDDKFQVPIKNMTSYKRCELLSRYRTERRYLSTGSFYVSEKNVEKGRKAVTIGIDRRLGRLIRCASAGRGSMSA